MTAMDAGKRGKIAKNEQKKGKKKAKNEQKKGKGQSRISPSLGGRERVLKSCLKKATVHSNYV
jgi:hypothetical protein